MTAALFRHVTKCPTALVMDSVSMLMFVSAIKEGKGKIVHSTHAHIWTTAQGVAVVLISMNVNAMMAGLEPAAPSLIAKPSIIVLAKASVCQVTNVVACLDILEPTVVRYLPAVSWPTAVDMVFAFIQVQEMHHAGVLLDLLALAAVSLSVQH